MSIGEPVFPGRETILDPEHELPAATPELHRLPENSTVHNAAESVGSAVGSAVSAVRNLPDRLQEMKQRFTVIRGRTQGQARETAREVKDKAQERVAEARVRINRMAREYPFGVVLAAAGAAFVVGMILRIWRDHD